MRQYQSESINELAAALAKAQGEMSHAGKGVENAFFKSKYADLPALIDAAKPALAANGLSVIQIPDCDESGNVVLITQLNHSSGQWARGWYPVKPIKNDPQGLGSAMTYARRYSYGPMTGVVAMGEDDDGNAASGHPQSKGQSEEKGEFESQEIRQTFVANCVGAIKNAENGTSLSDQRTLNAAKWDAMSASKVAADVEAYNEISRAFKAKVSQLKAEAEKKPATVEAAKNSASALGDDEIPF